MPACASSALMLNSSWPLLTACPSLILRLVILPDSSLLIITDSSANTEPVAATSSVRLVARTTYTCTARRCPPPLPPGPPLAAPPLPPPPPFLSSAVVLGKYFILTKTSPAISTAAISQPSQPRPPEAGVSGSGGVSGTGAAVGAGVEVVSQVVGGATGDFSKFITGENARTAIDVRALFHRRKQYGRVIGQIALL